MPESTLERKKFPIWIGAALVVIALAVGGYYWWSQKPAEKPAELTKITFATVPFIGEAPFYVAYHNGYFEEEGLNVTFKFNPGGWMSLKKILFSMLQIMTMKRLGCLVQVLVPSWLLV